MKSQHQAFLSGLRARMNESLPAWDAHLKMVPSIRQKEMQKRRNVNQGKKAAVLICFFPDKKDEISFVLIRRNEYDGVHSGQISFPGGRYEEEDDDLIQTALREAEEEVAINSKNIEVLGVLTPIYIPPSNFYVQPVLAWVDHLPDFVPQEAEVSEILKVSLKEILDPACRQEKNIPHQEYKRIQVPCFYIQEHIIWGATAMILSEVVELFN
jgi:8-oxo-dGTP pyrophosphatase MutT (NUDIX family)